MAEKRKIYKKSIHSIKEIAQNVFVLSFARDFEFRAGQVVAIDLTPDGQPRLYSIASGELDEYIEILFDEKPDGKLTPKLSALLPGDTIYVSEPFGNFICNDESAWWIASGTGVAPFVSMVRSGQEIGKILIHGGRYDENFYFSDLLENKLSGNYIRCATQQADSAYYKGRLTGWLREQSFLPTELKYYLCGSPEMVVEVRDLLISRHIPFGQIISETYF